MEIYIYPCDGVLHVYFKDISERKQSEVALRQSEERFRKVFENAGLGIAIMDWGGRFQQCNPAYCVLLGYTEKELSRISFNALVHPEDREANITLIDHLKSGQLRSFETKIRYIHKKGHTVWVQKFVSILPDRKGRPANLMALVSDITRIKKTKRLLEKLNRDLVERTKLAEQHAREVQRLAIEVSSAEDRERKRLATVLHDDFQQTLAYLKLKLANLHKGAGMVTNLATLNKIIDGCIQACRNLAHELNPHIIEQKGFYGALRWLCSQMKELQGLEVSLQTTGVPEIKTLALASMLIRSIRELLFNVVKHSGENRASVFIDKHSDILMITVEDAGRGCDYERLGEKQLKGSVYGLYSIEDRVEVLGGHMQVESQPGKGFRVTLEVPLDVSDRSETKPIRVVLADDHEVMREGLAKLFKDEPGVDVVGMAADGEEAVALATQLTPDVVVMDVSMPGMNGIDATRQISNRLPGTAIIGLTMHTDPDIHQAMRDAGSRACMTKAESADKLVETARSLLSDRF